MSGAKGKQLLLRADANSEIGSGHLMRMMALGQAWLEQGGSATLATKQCPNGLSDKMKQEGLELHQLFADSPAAEAVALRTFANEGKFDFIVLDGYDFGTDYQRVVHEANRGLMIVDDYLHLTQYHADLIFNQNIGTNPQDYEVCAAGVPVLAGLQFALLRKSFVKVARETAQWRKSAHSNASNVLVTLGGADPNNVSQLVLDELTQLKAMCFQVRLLIGSNSTHRQQLMDVAVEHPWLTVLSDVDDMVAQYRWADVALVAGGSTNWELSLFQVPRLIVVLAENQIAIAERLAAAGVALNVGDWRTLISGKIAESLRQLISDQELQQTQMDSCRSLVDGLGAERVVNYLLEFIRKRELEND